MDIEKITQAVLERLFVPLEASGRHVHVTEAAALTLFGHGLTHKRDLSQPGQYLARERVTVVGPKGSLEQVAVLGPARKASQVEISLTDARVLGIQAPVRLSGDIQGSPGVTLVGEQGSVKLDQGVIVAKRHVHLNPEAGRRLGVRDKQVVSLETFTGRPVIFRDLVVRISPDFQPAVHLDYDEANACGFRNGDLGRLLP